MLINTVQYLSVFCCLGVALAVLPSLYGGILFAWHPLLMVVGYLGERWCPALELSHSAALAATHRTSARLP